MNWEALSALSAIFVPIGGAMCVVLWWIMQKIRSDVDLLEQALAAHRLHVAENYVTNGALAKALDGVNDSLKEIFLKLDKIMDSKADKECRR